MPTTKKQTLDSVVDAIARRGQQTAPFSILLYGIKDAEPAALRVAQAAEAKLLRVDLKRIVSKYIGETEKNLRQVFRNAEKREVLLFFDESDALFGKRTDVKDSHDRFANAETNYLLQRMEEHDGVVILATNDTILPLRFRRRFDLAVDLKAPAVRPKPKKRVATS